MRAIMSHTVNIHQRLFNCLSAIRFRGGVILQVSCYTLLRGYQLPWSPSCCLHHTEHPFAFIGRLEQL